MRAARSASPHSTQNSLPSGSARTAQPRPVGLRWSSTSFAPSARMRSTSSSRVRSWGWRSTCSRFLTVFASGTVTKRRVMPSAVTRASGSPGKSSSAIEPPRTSAQKVPCR
ncbi:hypothetical protein DMA15_15755 [Streptomyces sp. WAC 01529]|nr:hypothetical protein DMA15_15755 [Streptomyces sp. WAC 01529]